MNLQGKLASVGLFRFRFAENHNALRQRDAVYLGVAGNISLFTDLQDKSDIFDEILTNLCPFQIEAN